MPIYEYRCNGCKRVFSFLVGVVADSGDPQCPRCKGKNLTKLISRPARVRSKQSIEDLADPSALGDMNDPKAMAQWVKKMGRTLGDEAGEDFEEEIDNMLDNPSEDDEHLEPEDDGEV